MYLDASIIIKLLTVEPDSEFFQNALEGQILSSSELVFTEVWSALLAKERGKFITRRQRIKAWRVFNMQISDRQLTLHPLNTAVLKKSNHVLEICHPAVSLRTLDALHIATCDLNQDIPLCTMDGRMRRAARILKIPIFPND